LLALSSALLSLFRTGEKQERFALHNPRKTPLLSA